MNNHNDDTFTYLRAAFQALEAILPGELMKVIFTLEVMQVSRTMNWSITLLYLPRQQVNLQTFGPS